LLGIISRGPTCTKKPFNVIIANPIRKPINSREEEENGVGQIEREISKNKREHQGRKERERELVQESIREPSGRSKSFASRCFSLQDIHTNTTISLVVSPLTELYMP